MKHSWKTILCMMTMFCLTGCAEKEASSQVEKETTAPPVTTIADTIVTTEPTTTPAPIPQGINPLTGEAGFREAAVGKRPIAVMINNIRESLPQYGVGGADILYELNVEGGITRMMGVYADYEMMPNVCSVRSCRYYYPILAYGMDAIYCHWGMDQTIAKDTLNRLRIDRLDGGGNGWQVCFFRDQERLQHYSSEHTGYLDGSKVAAALTQYNYRTETTHGNAFNFRAPSENVCSGEPCRQAVLHFSYAYWSRFTYDETTHLYMKEHNGAPHMDCGTDTQLGFTNVFALQTNVGLRENKYLVDIKLEGGSGYYISAGGSQPIRWEKTAESEPIRVYDSNGEELNVNSGKSYIGFIGYNCGLELLA